MRSSPNMKIKRINRNRIYKFIMQQGITSKAEIGYKLRLSLPTVTQNITELMNQNLIIEDGEFESTGGRRAKMISCNTLAKVAIGIDITRYHISAVVVDLQGNVIDNLRKKIDSTELKTILIKIQHLIDLIIHTNSIDDKTILGVGVSLPSIIADDKQTIKTAKVIPFPKDFYQMIQQYVRFPFFFYNDANCGGFAELWRRMPSKRDMFYFSLSSTVGGAAMINNQIYTGCDYFSGEIGHVLLIPNGRVCYCGQKGCVDTYCNSNCLSMGGDLSEFFDRLSQGDKQAKAQMKEYLDYLAIAIHNVHMLFDCDMILGGYVGSYSNLFLDSLKQRLRAMDTFERNYDYITGCYYHTEASAVGAALILINQFISEI
jgi:predicted NBD/HSP70 family sugar kinase